VTFRHSDYLPTDEASAAELGLGPEMMWSQRRYFYLKRCEHPDDEPWMLLRGVLLDSGWRTMYLERWDGDDWIDARDRWWQTVQECDYWDISEEEALAAATMLSEKFRASREAHARAEAERLERQQNDRDSTRINAEDVGPMGAAAIALHQLFAAFVEAGFAEDQALTLTAGIARDSRETNNGRE